MKVDLRGLVANVREAMGKRDKYGWGYTLERLVDHVAELEQQVETTKEVVAAARKLWLWNCGYVSPGVEIPVDVSDDALDEEEANRRVTLYLTVKALEDLQGKSDVLPECHNELLESIKRGDS